MKPKLQTSTAAIFLKPNNMKGSSSLEEKEEEAEERGITFDENVESENESEDSLEASKPRNKKVVGTRTKQRHFLSNKLKSLKDMSPKLYSEIMVGPALQYFLASLCDWKVKDENKRRLGLRYAKTPEVQKLISKLQKSKFISREIKNADPNAIVSVLKEVLTEFPGGIFADSNEEFLCVSLKSPQEIALIYANGLVEALPIFLRQFTYLVCKSLRNLARQSSGSLIDSYTDLLLLFTPILFPNSVGDVSRFLRATRISLILVDLCDTVFRPFLTLPFESNTDSAYHSDEDFFRDIVNSLNNLQDTFDSDDDSADSALSPDADFSDEIPFKQKVMESNNQYYQITYMDQ